MYAVRASTSVVASAALRQRAAVSSKKFNPLAAHVARKGAVAKARFSVQANSSGPSADGEVDLWRDTPVRYMGYSNEVGEAFAAFLPGWGVPASYGVAAVYVMLDTLDKGKKAYDGEADDSQKLKRGAIVSLDTFTWQMLASVFWPGSFIRCVVNTATVAIAFAHLDLTVGGFDVAKALPTAAGLAAIPFIVKPIDGTIDTAMEMSVSKALNGKIEGASDAGVAVATIAACLAVPPTLFTVAAAIKDLA
jgi:fission process protein 1